MKSRPKNALRASNRVARRYLRMRGFTARHIQTSGGVVHVMEAKGSGSLPPLVMLHGLSSCGLHYSPLLPTLRRQVRHLVAPDLPGHGFSDVPMGGMSGARMRAGLFEALDEVLSEPAVIFGNSMGGLAAIRYAQSRPERVRALLICSPVGAPMGADELSGFIEDLRLDTHQKAVQFVDRFLKRKYAFRHILAPAVRRTINHHNVQSLLSTLGHEDLLTPEDLADLNMPVHLLWGGSERLLPRSGRDFFAQHLPKHAELGFPEHFSHAPYIEHPVQVTQYILRYLRRLEAQPPEPTVTTGIIAPPPHHKYDFGQERV